MTNLFKNLGPNIRFFLGLSYCVFYGTFCFYCFYDWFFFVFFENCVYSIELIDDVKDKTTESKVKKKKVRSWFKKERKFQGKDLPEIKGFSFPGAIFTFNYYLALINYNFNYLAHVKSLNYNLNLGTSVKSITSSASAIMSKNKTTYEVLNPAVKTTSDVLEQYKAPIRRGQDRNASGDRVAKAMEAAIKDWIINYKAYCVPFTNILDKSSIFAFDKWLYGEYNALVRIDRFLKPKCEQDFSDFVFICQFMEKYNSKYNLTRDELDYLITFRNHYDMHCVKWDFVEGLICLESYKNNLELLEKNGLDVKNVDNIRDLIKVENIKEMENIDNIIDIDKSSNIGVLNVKQRIPNLLRFDLDLRLAYAKHSVDQDNYFGRLKIFKYTDDKLERFLKVKKRFDDRILLVNILEGFALLDFLKPDLTPSKLGECLMFGLQNYEGRLYEYLHVLIDDRLQRLPISIIHDHFKYDPTFNLVYNKLVKDKKIDYLNIGLIDCLHTFFYGNGPCEEFLRILILQLYYPNSLVLLNSIKNSAPDNFSFEDIIGVFSLHNKYNKTGEMEWGYYFTGRKYSVKQLIKFYQLLHDPAGKDQTESEILFYLKQNDKLFSTYYNVDEISFQKKAQRRGGK